MSTRTPNLNLINPVASEKGALTTYVTNNNAIDTAYGQSLENVAPIEGSTASKNYAIGTYMVKDGGLYKVTAAIATGETITVGTNVTATSLNEAVADLNSAVATLSTKIGNVGNTSLQSQVSTLQDSVSQATYNITSYFANRTSGSAVIYRRGKICMIVLTSMVFNNQANSVVDNSFSISEHSDLPQPISGQQFSGLLQNVGVYSGEIWLDTAGKLHVRTNSTRDAWGECIYLCL